MTSQPSPGSDEPTAEPLRPTDPGWAAAQVHPGVRATAAWTWRLLLIGVGLYVVGRIFLRTQDVLVPVAIALLLSALLVPAVDWFEKRGVPRLLAALLSVAITIAVVIAAMVFVVEQLVVGVPRMSSDVADSVTQARSWLEKGPLGIDSDALRNISGDLVHWLKSHEASIASGALDGAAVATKFATSALLTIFVLIFFVYEGRKIWEFSTRLIPGAHRDHIRGAGHAGFDTLKSYVRATVLVAFIDATCIGIGLAILRVPLVLPLVAIIFLGSFIPIVGSIAAGSLAVVVALATEGWVTALLVVVVLVVVMQLEGHVLQPFLLGRSVRLHPVAVIIVIALGLTFAGIVGGLLAVPILAFANTAIGYRHREATGEQPVELGESPPAAD